MIEYAKALGASQEVIEWCATVIKAREKKQKLDQSEVEHIIDYLISDAAPSRLRRMSYEQAKDSADKWSKANQKKGRHIVDGSDDIEPIHDFSDGSRIVKLLTKQAYQREGFFMAHCVGSYNPEKSTIYSYRDADNIPHATFEVTGNGNQIQQIKGKGNGPIHPRYIDAILTFLQVIGVKVRPSEMKNLGYTHLDKEAEAIIRMFVDPKGKPAPIVSLMGEKYLYGA